MPRTRPNQTLLFYAPTNIRKSSTSKALTSIYSPTISRSRSTSTSSTFAPSTYLSRSAVAKGYYDYNPSYSTYTYQDYNPLLSTSLSYILKYAPSLDFEYYYRYAPATDNQLYYEPKLVSRFKPRPVIVSNADTLDSYFRYVVQLLRVLR